MMTSKFSGKSLRKPIGSKTRSARNMELLGDSRPLSRNLRRERAAKEESAHSLPSIRRK